MMKKTTKITERNCAHFSVPDDHIKLKISKIYWTFDGQTDATPLYIESY